MSTDLIISPVGKIQFLALKHPVAAKFESKDSDDKVFTVRLEFDGTTAEAKAFRKQIETINPAIVGTKNAAAGNFTVKAATKFPVMTLDSSGNVIAQEDLPVFSKGSTGTARMIVKPYTGNSLGGSINLTGVQLQDLELSEPVEGPSMLDQLRSALAKKK